MRFPVRRTHICRLFIFHHLRFSGIFFTLSLSSFCLFSFLHTVKCPACLSNVRYYFMKLIIICAVLPFRSNIFTTPSISSSSIHTESIAQRPCRTNSIYVLTQYMKINDIPRCIFHFRFLWLSNIVSVCDSVSRCVYGCVNKVKVFALLTERSNTTRRKKQVWHKRNNQKFHSPYLRNKMKSFCTSKKEEPERALLLCVCSVRQPLFTIYTLTHTPNTYIIIISTYFLLS